MSRRWNVCIGADVEDVEIDADAIWYSQDTGWLAFSREGVKSHVAVFAPGKWLYFMEVTDDPAAR